MSLAKLDTSNYVSLSDIMDGIDGYDKVFKTFGFTPDGSGSRPWSFRVKNTDGEVVEFNAQGWDLIKGTVTCSGRNHVDLRALLIGSCSYEQLITLLTAEMSAK